MTFEYKKEDYITNIEELKKYIKLSSKKESKLKEVIKIHPMKISKDYLSLINQKSSHFNMG